MDEPRLDMYAAEDVPGFLQANEDALAQMFTGLAALVALERRGVVTFDKTQADTCCGTERDADGFCRHREYHPIYIDMNIPEEGT